MATFAIFAAGLAGAFFAGLLVGRALTAATPKRFFRRASASERQATHEAVAMTYRAAKKKRARQLQKAGARC